MDNDWKNQMQTTLPRTIVISGFPVGRTAAVIKQELPRLKNNSYFRKYFLITFSKYLLDLFVNFLQFSSWGFCAHFIICYFSGSSCCEHLNILVALILRMTWAWFENILSAQGDVKAFFNPSLVLVLVLSCVLVLYILLAK